MKDCCRQSKEEEKERIVNMIWTLTNSFPVNDESIEIMSLLEQIRSSSNPPT